ncbi:hypothetical protein [Streptomyces sp. NPDC001480]|uniref:hypothetical protein n=1 Tax=Streptomyces sp. NPDC001480 TaxID=3364577 RepID=UPI0036A45C2B
MVLTRPDAPAQPEAGPTGEPYGERADAARHFTEVPAPPAVAVRAVRLEKLLGAPFHPANPYGRLALAAAPTREPAVADDVFGGVLPDPDEARRLPADQLVRLLRPLFSRDLALSYDWAIRPVLEARPAADEVQSGPAVDEKVDGLGALLGPAALVAAAGGALRTAARMVASVGDRRPEVRQWQPALAAVFADLLACESLTTVALRALRLPAGAAPELVAAVGYVVPHVVGGVLADLELVLNESGFGPGTTERRVLAKLMADRAHAGVDWAAAVLWQGRLVRALPALGGVPRHREHPAFPALFRLWEEPVADVPADGDGGLGTVAATLTGAAARLNAVGAKDPANALLARVARRLVTEQRSLRHRCLAATDADPAAPAARALAERQALLLLAAAVLGVREAAAGVRTGFLGQPGWALLALVRVSERLGVPVPRLPGDPRAGVWTELAERSRRGVDCDVYATKPLW